MKPAARCQERAKDRMLFTPPTSPRAESRCVTEDLRGEEFSVRYAQAVQAMRVGFCRTFCAACWTGSGRQRPRRGCGLGNHRRRRRFSRRWKRRCLCRASPLVHIGPMSRGCDYDCFLTWRRIRWRQEELGDLGTLRKQCGRVQLASSMWCCEERVLVQH